MDWRDSAACRDHDPELFFPLPSDPVKEVQEVCRDCPVKATCLDWSITAGERYGIWGGLDADERTPFIKPRRM